MGWCSALVSLNSKIKIKVFISKLFVGKKSKIALLQMARAKQKLIALIG